MHSPFKHSPSPSMSEEYTRPCELWVEQEHGSVKKAELSQQRCLGWGPAQPERSHPGCRAHQTHQVRSGPHTFKALGSRLASWHTAVKFNQFCRCYGAGSAIHVQLAAPAVLLHVCRACKTELTVWMTDDASGCSVREQLRGDSEVWGPLGNNSVGLLQDLGLKARYAYDQCFDGTHSNDQVSWPISFGRWRTRGSASSRCACCSGLHSERMHFACHSISLSFRGQSCCARSRPSSCRHCHRCVLASMCCLACRSTQPPPDASCSPRWTA